jgi:hypothetical protein
LTTTLTSEAMVAKIESAFGDEPVPPPDEVLAPGYRTSIDAEEMLLAFRGKHWTQLSTESLFYHREMIRALSASGYRAYIAAFMRASLEDGRYAADLRSYTVSSFQPLEDTPQRHDESREQLSLLTAGQRSTIAEYLRYLAGEHGVEEAGRVLEDWATRYEP